MDLTRASQAHGEWKVKLRLAIAKKEQLDERTISANNCCALGKWLHGEAKSHYSGLRALGDCTTKHAAFHREAGVVARTINARDYAKAEQMLGAGTAYSTASSAVISAILALRKEAALA